MNKVILETKHFQPRELQCRCGCGIGDMSYEFMMKIEKVREDLGLAMIVTSAYRCPSHNKAVGGAIFSLHPSGQAMDILCDNSFHRAAVLESVIRTNVIKFIEIGPEYIHIDNRPGGQLLVSLALGSGD